jgi:uncharacterized protein (DUF58 family)
MVRRLSDDVIRKIKEIEIVTRRLLSGSLVGDTRSAQKGVGFEFDQLREYQQGDDVRCIDWRASARMNKLLIKQYIEERRRTILVAVDVSHSGFFSSSDLTAQDAFAQIASVLSLVAEYGKDQIGLLLFSDIVEYYIPPSGGKFHTRKIMETVFTFEPKNKKTNIAIALEHMAKLKRKDAILFVLSDFIDVGFDRQLALASAMYDVIAIRYLDKNTKTLPTVGLLTVEDIETGEINTINMSKQNSSYTNLFLHARLTEQNNLFKKYGVSVIDIDHDRHFIEDIIRFFRRRMSY